MRDFTFLFILVCGLSPLFAQTHLSDEAWREDLQFLQKTVHADYPFLFKKVSARTFDAAVSELYQDIPRLEDHEVVVGLARLVALFGYGHTSLNVSGWRKTENFDFSQLPFNMYWFKDGIYLQSVHRDYAGALGAKVLEVEGMPIKKALDAIRPVISIENEQYFRAFGINRLAIPEVLHAQGVTAALQKTVRFKLEKNGKTFEQAFTSIDSNNYPGRYSFFPQNGDWLDARTQSNTPLWLSKLDQIYFYEYLPERKAVYVRHSQIQDDEVAIPEFYAEVFDFIDKNDVERLILDVRLNGGGNNYKNKPIVTGVIANKKINKSGNFFVVIGRRTFSACQNLVNELDNYTNAIFVGEPTSENINFYGDNNTLILPNSKLPVRLSFAWWQDKPQWENDDWLAPHLATELSFADYQNNHDPVLETIWKYDSKEAIVEPITYLTSLYEKGQVNKLKSEAKRLVKDPMYRYLNFEDQFNNIGYRVMGRNDFQTALFVFQLNTELFPESANTWDSLAEAHWKSGDKYKAIEYYQKAIRMDPHGPVGQNARTMLAELKKE